MLADCGQSLLQVAWSFNLAKVLLSCRLRKSSRKIVLRQEREDCPPDHTGDRGNQRPNPDIDAKARQAGAYALDVENIATIEHTQACRLADLVNQ